MAGPGYELKENEAKAPAQVLDRENRSLQSFAPPYVGNYAEGAKNQYKIDSDTRNRIQADVNQITRAIRFRSDSLYWQTQIVLLIAGWKEQDRRLSGSMGSPHLDKGLELLETEAYSNTSIGGDVLQQNNGIEQLYFFLNSGKRRTFIEQLKASDAYKHYAEYMKPEITNALLDHELITAQKISQCIKRGDIAEADSLLSKSSFYNIDDVALGVLRFLDDKELNAFVSHSDNARRLAAKLIDELSSVAYTESERRKVEDLKKAYSDWFLGRNDPERQDVMVKSLEKWSNRVRNGEDLRKRETGDIFKIPIGSAGFGVGESTISASLGNDGRILVRAHLKTAHIGYEKQLPYYIETNGIWLNPDEPVVLEFVDPETARKFQRSEIMVPASFLLEISNEGTTEVVQKLLAWGLAGVFAPFMAVPAIGVAGVEGSSALMVAVALATEAVGAVSLTLNLIRKDLIILYGDEAEKWFAILDVVDMAVGIYGLGTLLYHAPSILKGLRDFPSKFLKENVARKNAWLTPEEMAKVNKDLEILKRAEQEVSKIKEPVGGVSPRQWDPFKGEYEKFPQRVSKPRPNGPWLERVGETSPRSGTGSAMSSPLPGSGQRLSAPRLEAVGMSAPSVGQRPLLPSGSGGAVPKPTGPAALAPKGAGPTAEPLTPFPMRPASESVPPPSLRTLAEDTERSATVLNSPFGNKPTPDWVSDPAFIPKGWGAGPSGSGSAEARLEFPVSLPPKPASDKTVTESEGWRFASSGNSGVFVASEVKPSAGVKTSGSDLTTAEMKVSDPNLPLPGLTPREKTALSKPLSPEGVAPVSQISPEVPPRDFPLESGEFSKLNLRNPGKKTIGPKKSMGEVKATTQNGADPITERGVPEFDTSRPMLGAPEEHLETAPIPEGNLPEFDTSRPMLSDMTQPVDLGLMPSGPRLKSPKSKRELAKFGKPFKRIFGEPSEFSSGTNRRIGMHFNERNAAETMYGLETDYNITAGRPNSVKYRVVAGTRERVVQTDRAFTRQEATEGAQATTDDYTNTGWDRGHLAQREAFKGNIDAELAADQMPNIVPMHPNLNRGEGSPWRAAEAETIRLADKYGSVTVEVTPVYDTNPPRLPNGTPIPKEINRKVIAPDGKVLLDISYPNK
jgi:hypothetical protein